ncbi:hypothetical protein [Flavobacterium caeni]|uniref:Uncharacterized protein n=1 Tax=Flavobacterium caeni TaxID=490189 RepID=A0A1G5K323_9FLAO|nr:hypothetical protein [Flavobacterium caeni]SCY94490.1 hypothetical protein SAMN02927903_03031 [Flavobacterium caeni]
MKQKTFLKKRDQLLKKKKAFEAAINKEYNKFANAFIDENSPVKRLMVYELIENGIRRRGFTRFVIYAQDVTVWDKSPIIRVGGWWLDQSNVPTKWDNMTVYGVGNPAVFKLSENQTAEKHPDSDEHE